MFLVSSQSDLVVSLKGTRGHAGPSETGDRKRGAGARGGDNRPFVEELSKPEVPSQQLALCTGNLGCRIVCCVCWRVGRVAFLFVNQFVSHSIKHSGQTGRVMALTLLSRQLLLNIQSRLNLPSLTHTVTHGPPLLSPRHAFVPQIYFQLLEIKAVASAVS